jgi:polyadenylation factor subunit 2
VNRPKNRIEAYSSALINEISFSMSSAKFASAANDSTVKVWDFATSKLETQFKEHSGNVLSVNWHPFQALVATGGKDSSLRIWDPRTQTSKSIFRLDLHQNEVSRVRWNPVNGIYLLTGSRDSKIKLFDIRAMDREVKEMEDVSSMIGSLLWHPFKEEVFASGCLDGNL